MSRPAFLIHSAVPSGAELCLVRYSGSLQRLNPLYVSLSDGPIVEQLRRFGAEVLVLTPRGEAVRTKRDAGLAASAVASVALIRLGRELVDRDIGVLVPLSLKAGVVAFAAGRHLSVPIVWWMHDRLASDYMGIVRSAAARLFVRSVSSGLIVNSRSTFAALKSARLPALLSPPTVDKPKVPLGHRTQPSGPLRLALIGRISPWKGQLVLLKAISQLPKGVVEECHIFGGPLFGEDDYLAEVQRAVARLNLGEVVKLHGHVPDVHRYLMDVDVVVHASTIPEPFGAVVIEGLAAGCLVVAADAGGPAEVISDGVDGFLYRRGDDAALADALHRIFLMDPARLAEISLRGRRVAERYATRRLGPVLTSWVESWLSEQPPTGWIDGTATRPLGA